MSVIVFAGAAQFAAVGYVASGLAWPGVVLLTGLLNARHLLYSAALRPWLEDVPLPRRALMAHLLTDEAFALSIGHFRRIGRTDEWGFWVAAVGATFIPWNLATIAGVFLGGQIPDPARFGIDIIFPAAMVGLAVGLDHRAARARRGDRRSRHRGGRGPADEPVDRDRRRRDPRTGDRAARPGERGPGDGPARDVRVG